MKLKRGNVVLNVGVELGVELRTTPAGRRASESSAVIRQNSMQFREYVVVAAVEEVVEECVRFRLGVKVFIRVLCHYNFSFLGHSSWWSLLGR